MNKTKIFVEKFKGYDCFSVWPVDESGNKIGQYPILSMGAKKAAAVLKHMDELKGFVDSHAKEVDNGN